MPLEDTSRRFAEAVFLCVMYVAAAGDALAINCTHGDGSFETSLAGESTYEVAGCGFANTSMAILTFDNVANTELALLNTFRRVKLNNVRNFTLRVTGNAIGFIDAYSSTPSYWALLQITGLCTDITIVLDNVTLGAPTNVPTTLPVVLVEAQAATLHRVSFSVTRSRVFSYSMNEFFPIMYFPGGTTNLSLRIVDLQLKYVWWNPCTAGPMSTGLIRFSILNVLNVSCVVESSDITLVVDNAVVLPGVKPPGNSLVAFVMVKDVQRTLTQLKYFLFRSTDCSYLLNETAPMLSALQVFGVQSYITMNITNMTLELLRLRVAITSHDSAVWCDWHDVLAMKYLRVVVQDSQTTLLCRGRGDMTAFFALSREAAILKTDKAIANNSFFFLESIEFSIQTPTTTDAADGDQSTGSNANLVHLGNLFDSTVLIRNVTGTLGIPMSYPSKKPADIVKVFTTSTNIFLLDSDALANRAVISARNRITLREVTVSVSQAFFPSDSVSQPTPLSPIGVFGYIMSSGLLSLSVSSVNTSFHVERCSVKLGGFFVARRVALYAMDNIAAVSLGAAPREGVITTYEGNTFILRRIVVDVDAPRIAAVRSSIAPQALSQMKEIKQCNVFVFTGTQDRTVLDIDEFHQPETAASVAMNMIALTGVPVTVNEPAIAAVIAQFADGRVLPVSQLRDTELSIRNTSVLNGTVFAVASTSHFTSFDGSSGIPVLLVADSTFESRGAYIDAMSAVQDTTTRPLPLLALKITSTSFKGYRALVGKNLANWTNVNLQQSAAYTLDCIVWNDEPLYSSSGRATGVLGIPRALLPQRKSDHVACPGPIPTATPLPTASMIVILPKIRKKRADTSMSPYLAVAALASSVVHSGASVFMQRSLSLLRLCDEGGEEIEAPPVTDSPFQMQLGASDEGTGGYTAGTVLGNLCFVFAYLVLAVVVAVACRVAREQRGRRVDPAAIWRDLWRDNELGLPGFAIGPLMLVFQPTMTASLQVLIYTRDSVGIVVLGSLVPLGFLATACFLLCKSTLMQECTPIDAQWLARREAHAQLKKRHHEQQAANGVVPPTPPQIVIDLVALATHLTTPRVQWVGRSRKARDYAVRYEKVYDGMRQHRLWFLWVELGTAAAYGALCALQFDDASDCRGQLIANEVLSVVCFALGLAWAYNLLLFNWNYFLNTLLMVIAGALLLLDDTDSATLISLIAAWIGIVFTTSDVLCAVVCFGWAEALRRMFRRSEFVHQRCDNFLFSDLFSPSAGSGRDGSSSAGACRSVGQQDALRMLIELAAKRAAGAVIVNDATAADQLDSLSAV